MEPQTTSTGSNPASEAALKPFQEASMKFLQAVFSARENAVREHTLAWLDVHSQMREAERSACEAVENTLRKYITSQTSTGGDTQEVASAQAAQRFEYENAVREVYADTQAKLNAVLQKASSEGQEEIATRLAKQHQSAYDEYMNDLQRAWSGAPASDPQTITAIASTIMFTINAAGQGS